MSCVETDWNATLLATMTLDLDGLYLYPHESLVRIVTVVATAPDDAYGLEPKAEDGHCGRSLEGDRPGGAKKGKRR